MLEVFGKLRRRRCYRAPLRSSNSIGGGVVGRRSGFRDFGDLSYVFRSRGNDPRPYLTVMVYDVCFCGLLDSGASVSIIGGRGWSNLCNLGDIRLRRCDSSVVTVANGQRSQVVGSVDLPISLENKVKVINCLVVPEVDMDLILGIDFWKEMDIVPEFRQGNWNFQANVATVTTKLELSGEQRRVLDGLVAEGFQRMGTGLACAKGVTHVIDTGDAVPIKQRYYPVSPYLQEVMNEELDKMLELGVVEPSHSPWSSPVVLIKKKDGTYPFCIDFRALNQVTKRDAYAIPYISMILDRLRNARFLSSIDLKSAYWQIPLDSASKEKTSFTVPGRGLFQFTRLPFGLHNAPATWQRFVDQALGHDVEPHVFIYLDDIILATPDFESHIRLLKCIFERLAAAGLTVNQEKCEFVKPQLRYLGYVVDREGLRVDPDKVAGVMGFPTPTKVTEVRRFLGLASFYRRFVPHFAEKVVPLTNLTKKRKQFKWTAETEQAFLDLKQCLVTAPILTCPHFNRRFIVQTDASQKALGAVLVQNFDEGEKVVAYASRTLTTCESKYCATELECLAVL